MKFNPNKSISGRCTSRDEYGNADILGVDMSFLLGLDYEEMNTVQTALNRLADFEDRIDSGSSKHEITIEKLMNVVHNYTDPIRIHVVMGSSWTTCEEAKHMHDFYLTSCYSYRDDAEKERLLKYYKDVPVWNLVVWTDGMDATAKGRAMYMGIEAHCHYKDIREGWLAEKADRKRAKQREYRKRKKKEKEMY